MSINLTTLNQAIANFNSRLVQRFSDIVGRLTPLEISSNQHNTLITQQSVAIGHNVDRLNILEQTKANMRQGQFVASPQELIDTQNAQPDQAVIFNTWHRFSHSAGNENQPAIPSEINAWTYDSVNEQIQNTTNSSSYIGVVSKLAYEKYLLDVTIASTSTDDDYIGLVLAWDVDPVTGREYTLSILRSPGGITPIYQLSYNHLRSDAWVVENASPLVTWGNNQPGHLTKSQAGFSGTPGWSGMAAFQTTDGTARLVATRDGDIIKVQTTQWDNPDLIDPSTEITIDLNSDPRLERFKGPSPYGFGVLSQPNSRWRVNQFTNPLDSIFDLSTGNVYIYENDTWEIDPNQSSYDLNENQFLFNPVTKKLFYFENPTSIHLVGMTKIEP